jgi:small subunit ribosomal protein S15
MTPLSAAMDYRTYLEEKLQEKVAGLKEEDLARLYEKKPLGASAAALKDRISEVRQTYRRHETDTGSPEYQVAGLTERISYLTNHLKDHPKDFSTRRGLVALVNKRRRLLNYLYKEDEKRYVEIVSSLGIRHRVPGAIPSKDDIYGRFPSAKPNKGKSKMKVAAARK